MKTLEKSKLAQKLHELYAPRDPQSRRRMRTNYGVVLSILGAIVLIIDIVLRFII